MKEENGRIVKMYHFSDYTCDENDLEIYLRSNCDLEDYCTLIIYKKE